MKTGLIFGSHAIKHWYPDYNPKGRFQDIDVIGKLHIDSLLRVENHEINSAFFNILLLNNDSYFVDPNILYTIKVSHAPYDIHWEKTMYDISFLRGKGCTLNLFHYTNLTEVWKSKYRSSRVNLNKTKDEFFNSNINRVYDHDHLHELVKVFSVPMHTLLKKENSEVMFSKIKWDGLSFSCKLITAAEEVWAISLERYSKFNPSVGFLKAIKQLITSSTSGYFRLFLIENYNILIKYRNNKNYKKLYRRLYDESRSFREFKKTDS